MNGTGPAPGLCGACRQARVVVSGKGSRFYLCTLSAADARYAKYPRLPVWACDGFENVGSEGSGARPSGEAAGGSADPGAERGADPEA